jgi:hypothetical protein
MTAGLTLYSAISSKVHDIREDSLAVARMSNVLLSTVKTMGATGMMVRKVDEYNAITYAAAGEEDDTGAQKFTKDALSTLTPVAYRARVDITDQRAETDYDSEIANASLEFGGAAAAHIDANIASNYSSLTGGTIGTAGSTITWRYITKAYALLINKGVPAGMPVYCALHPFQWEVLLAASTVAAATVAVAPGFQDRMTTSGGFFSIPQFVGITFAISNNIPLTSTNAYGAIYVPMALAVDTRKAFNIRPQRDESAESTELNSSMWYAHGVWRPDFGVAILSDCSTPS